MHETTQEPDETTSAKQVELLIRLPLPLSITGPLMAAIGQLWPSAMIKSHDTSGLCFILPGIDAEPFDASKIELPAIERGDDGQLYYLGPDGMVLDPGTELSLFWGRIAKAAFDNTPEAVNFVEYHLQEPESTGPPIRVHVHRPHGKTPTDLLAEAKKRIAELEQELAELAERTES